MEMKGIDDMNRRLERIEQLLEDLQTPPKEKFFYTKPSSLAEASGGLGGFVRWGRYWQKSIQKADTFWSRLMNWSESNHGETLLLTKTVFE